MARVAQLFFFGFYLIAHATTWTFNRDILEARLPIEVSVDELVRVLEEEGIDVRFQTQENLILWKDGRVSISLAPSPYAPYHLWIAVEGRKTLDECTADELAELYTGVWKSRKALRETIGAKSFMIFTTEEMRNGKGSPWVGLEIIPSGFEENSIMDALEKLALREYVFYNGFPARPISHSSEMLSTIREKLQTLEPAIEPEVLQGHWSQKLSHHEEALYENLRYTRNYLAQMGALVEGEMPPLPPISKTVHEMQIDLDLCAFCNSKVIDKQIVCDWKDIQILMGHKPCSPYGNFLILPKRHQCAWDLTREEAIASFEAVIALKTMFLEKTGLSNWICYIQDGPAVGQTVPHTHIHFFILPDPLKSFVTDMQHIHNQRPVLSYEEMRACCERARPHLLKYLRKCNE